jgi:hypothetical protein
MKEIINHLNEVFPYDKNTCEEKYMETVMDYIYSEIKDKLIIKNNI